MVLIFEVLHLIESIVFKTADIQSVKKSQPAPLHT